MMDIHILDEVIRKEYENMTGIVVMKDGAKEYEQYFQNCTRESRSHVYSVTKSIVSVLIGIAIDQGYIQGVNQKVLDFFPQYKIKRGEKTIQNITLKHLLTMTAPYKYKSAPYTKYFTSTDWVQSALDLLGGKGYVGEFRYAPIIGPDILTGILVKATGQPVLEFAAEHLFCPLEIPVPPNITFHNKEEQMEFYKKKYANGWVCDPSGTNTAGWGLTLSAMELAKIGQLYLNNGMQNGRQIVSSKWIHESTKEQSRWEKEKLPYGYLWWIDRDGKGYAAMGDGGSVIYVNREKRLAVSILSSFMPRPKDRIEFIHQYVEPIFGDES